MQKKIMIIEDEDSIRGFLRINLLRENFIVIEAACGEEGLSKIRLENPDVVLLDVMLPGMDGFDVCAAARKEFPQMGIIMLTARGQDMDKISGLESGADDYVVKPFNPIELILRVKALLRRTGEDIKAENDKIIESGALRLDLYAQTVFKNNNEISLTPKEYLLIKLFMEKPGKAFTRDELLNIVWGYDFIGDAKIVDVNIRRLRAKIEEDSSNPTYLETVWGTGYRWRK
ncbi:response regulator transcription factor [Clostridium swellfunianum]|uniref:response regulator transcription factor n=1 Tax=Clostridium swellfunianum TaxID=1367462 RepID=UPI00202DD7C5|nr:response regulator transcription factor [Clostridium swellfunianum]MCM0647491.1 response regulator transcription factor [Clostridium swellfunianum]